METARWRDAPRLTAIWEADWDDDGGLRGPSAVAVARGSGMVAVADHVVHDVTFVSPQGIVLGHWPRQASDSGPLSLPAALDWRSDGTLAVLDPVRQTVLRVDTAGRLAGESRIAPVLAANFPYWWVSLRGADIIGISDPSVVRADIGRMVTVDLLRTTDSGRGLDTVLTKSEPAVPDGRASPIDAPGLWVPVAAQLRDGRLAVAGDVAQFRIRILGPDGQVIRQLCRITSPSDLPEEDTAHALEPKPAERVPSRVRIGRLFSDHEGRLWAQRDRTSGVFLQDRWFGPPGARFDVLDATGEYLGEVRAPADTRLAAALGNTVIGLREDRTGRVTVVGFRLEAGER
jgi:hypothetical protein